MGIWRKACLAAVACSSVAIAAVACRQLVGIGDDPRAADTSACGLPWATGDCAACVASSCCDESSACASSEACSAYETCLAACAGDPACRARCEIDHPPGTRSEVPSLDACLAARCATACNLGCGSIAESFTPPDAAASCESCLGANACEVERPCAGSLVCEQYVRCTNACSTFGCQQSCGPDGGFEAFAPLGSVIAGSCANACAYGDNWLCVGHVSWPATTGTSTTLTVLVTDQLSQRAVAGAVVTPCRVDDLTCSAPLGDAGTSDDAGRAVVVFPQSATLPNGIYVLVQPPPAEDGGASPYLTSLSYARSPITESTKVLGAGLWQATDLDHLYEGAMITRDTDAGSISAQVFDCDLFRGRGATVKATTTTGDAALPVFYDLQAHATATDTTGMVAVPNAPTGVVDLVVTPPGGDRPSSHAIVISRAGAFTSVSLLPTP